MFTKRGQSSIPVRQLSKVPEVAKYLGKYEIEKKQPGTLLKPNRRNNFKVISHSLNEFHPQNMLVQGLLNCSVTSPDTCGSFVKYRAMIPETGDQISTGSSVLYRNMDDEMQIGIFNAGYLIIQKRKRYQLVAIQPAVKQPIVNDKVGCSAVQINESSILIPSKRVTGYIPLIHDCTGGRCRKREATVLQLIEQERRYVKKTTLHHNQQHKRYFINEYSLKMPKGFEVSKIV